jgi:hypothetical protein
MKKNFLFFDNETGEQFIVESENKALARDTAESFFSEPQLVDEISYGEAEMLGYDTY